MANQIKDLVSSKQIRGKYNAKTATFTPETHQQSITSEIEGYYRDNAYIEYDRVKRIMGISTRQEVEKVINSTLSNG